MRHLFRIVLVMLLIVIGNDDLYAQSKLLVVWLKNGEKVYYNLEERPKTTFSGGKVVITTSKLEVNYPLEQLLRYTYENVSSEVAINSTDNIRISQDGNVLTLENLKSKTSVLLFSMDGKLLETHQAQSGHPLSISLDAYPIGIYIIKANGVSYKMMRK